MVQPGQELHVSVRHLPVGLRKELCSASITLICFAKPGCRPPFPMSGFLALPCLAKSRLASPCHARPNLFPFTHQFKHVSRVDLRTFILDRFSNFGCYTRPQPLFQRAYVSNL